MKDLDVLEAHVINAAYEWWLARRPKDWSCEEHAERPEHGLLRESDCRLARRVARWAKEASR